MIVFKKLKYRNFLSTGNNFTEIQLDKNPSTLIIGTNGAGKSTLLDALSFALFGKPHRNINKPQLVNSINKKNCEVEIEFMVHGSNFKINRGIKPNKFEIWKDGDLVNQNSHNKEYQKILEQNILKLNHKSFHQIVVLGSSSFIPFMALPTNHRRQVIEDLLDINVFSKMNILLKEKLSLIRDNIKDTEYTIDIERAKLAAAKKNIEKIKSINSEQKKQKEDQIKESQTKIKDFETEIERLNHGLEDGMEDIRKYISEMTEKRSSEKRKYNDAERDIIELSKHAKFFENNDVCPTCDQNIEVDFKKSQIKDAFDKAQTTNISMDVFSGNIQDITKDIADRESRLETLSNKQTIIHGHNQSISQLNRLVSNLNTEISNISVGAGDLSDSLKDIESINGVLESLRDKKDKLNNSASYQKVVAELLKDTGIKTKIIKQYLPVINQLVNQYLQVLDFFVHFNLDEAFNETIRSRHRDIFTYDSFSEGEKQRIDLALLFTWRQVAKMKNSVATNLLILDETFDSSLDADGVDNLTKILHTLDDDTNVFIISHKTDMLEGKFENKIEFRKKKNFSEIV